MKNLVFILLSLISLNRSSAQTAEPLAMQDFMGANTNVAAYDNGYLVDLSSCVKWIREYHSWAHYEAANNSYKWDDITTNPHTYTWPDHNKYMNRCQELGVRVLIDALNKPGWMGSSHIPNDSGDGSSAPHYMEKLEFLGQLVARYGSKEIDELKLETADKATGLNMINYYEDENEPNYWWWSPKWPVADYAAYCNAAHDGYGVETNAEFPLLGIKSVDPDAKHVVAGSAGVDSLFFQQILDHSNGHVPFDVLNVHMYCTDQNNAYSPEHETYGYENQMAGLFKWKNRVLPDMPIWVTEFGWDTYKSSDNQHSYTYAPFEQQANYLMRSYFIFLKMGFEKAFMFMAADGNSKGLTQYSSSGLLKDKNEGYEKKPSYYYLATMQNILGEMVFSRALAYGEKSGANEIYCFEFEKPNNSDKIYVLWTRASGSDTDNGATANYQLDLGFTPETAFSVFPKNLDMDGDTASVVITGSSVNLQLTETPQFLVVSGLNTGIGDLPDKPAMKVFPNPSSGTVQLSITVPSKNTVSLAAYSANGQLVKSFLNDVEVDGERHFTFGEDFLPGIYFIHFRSEREKLVRKLIVQ